MAREKMQILICGGTSCSDKQSVVVSDNLKLELEANALENDVKVVRTGCFGLCNLGPIVKITPGDVIYTHVSPDDVREIVSEHIMKGQKVERLLYKDPSGKIKSSTEKELSVKKKQLRINIKFLVLNLIEIK